MAISNFGELKTAVGAWLAKDYGEPREAEFITLGLAYINRELRVRAMELAVDLTVSAQTVALPTRYLAGRRLYLSTSPVAKLDYMSPFIFWKKFVGSLTGQPKAFTIEGENLVFGPDPDGTYTGKFLYYQGIVDFTADSDTHALLTKSPDLFLYAALMSAHIFKGDAALAAPMQILIDKLIARMHREDSRDRHSGDAMQIRTEIGNP